MRTKEPTRAWTPPAGWPTPPAGWAPSPGWQPDTAWPPVPPEHHWWQLTSRGRRRRRNLIVAASLSVVLMGGFIAFVSRGGPCSFDPPPGDVGPIHVLNDTDQAVGLFDCDNATCMRGINPQQLPAGHSASRQYEMCGGGDIGVRNSTGQLIGCLELPVGEPPKTTHLMVSQTTRCATTNSGPIRPEIYNPS